MGRFDRVGCDLHRPAHRPAQLVDDQPHGDQSDPHHQRVELCKHLDDDNTQTAQDRRHGVPGGAEGTLLIGERAPQPDHRDVGKKDHEHVAKVCDVTQEHLIARDSGKGDKRPTEQDGRQGCFEARVDAREKGWQVAVTAQSQSHARRTEQRRVQRGDGSDHPGQAQQRRAPAAQEVRGSVGQWGGGGPQRFGRDDAQGNKGHSAVNNSTDKYGAHHSDRDIASRVLGFLGRGGDHLVAHEQNVDQRDGLKDLGHVVEQPLVDKEAAVSVERGPGKAAGQN